MSVTADQYAPLFDLSSRSLWGVGEDGLVDAMACWQLSPAFFSSLLQPHSFWAPYSFSEARQSLAAGAGGLPEPVYCAPAPHAFYLHSVFPGPVGVAVGEPESHGGEVSLASANRSGDELSAGAAATTAAEGMPAAPMPEICYLPSSPPGFPAELVVSGPCAPPPAIYLSSSTHSGPVGVAVGEPASHGGEVSLASANRSGDELSAGVVATTAAEGMPAAPMPEICYLPSSPPGFPAELVVSGPCAPPPAIYLSSSTHSGTVGVAVGGDVLSSPGCAPPLALLDLLVGAACQDHVHVDYSSLCKFGNVGGDVFSGALIASDGEAGGMIYASRSDISMVAQPVLAHAAILLSADMSLTDEQFARAIGVAVAPVM